VSGCLEYVVVRIDHFSIPECVLVKIISFSKSGMYHGTNCQLHHGCYYIMLYIVSSCQEYIMVKIVRFSVPGHGKLKYWKRRLFQPTYVGYLHRLNRLHLGKNRQI
jgi:hypothetical protein